MQVRCRGDVSSEVEEAEDGGEEHLEGGGRAQLGGVGHAGGHADEGGADGGERAPDDLGEDHEDGLHQRGPPCLEVHRRHDDLRREHTVVSAAHRAHGCRVWL